jgi:hypothetical protein
VVEHLTHDPNIKCLNPATNTGRGGKQISNIIWLCTGIVVGFSTHNNKVQGSNPIMGNLKKEIKETKRSTSICLCLCSTFVVLSAHDPQIKGLNPATRTGIREKA